MRVAITGLSGLALAALFAALGLIAAACSPAPTATTTVEVTVSDYAIVASHATLPAGSVKLDITNTGQVDHEVEVFTLPDGIDPAAIPVVNSVADTDAVGMTVIDEVEGLIPQGQRNLTVNLVPGRYALICNLPAHYGLGMHTTVTVR